MIRILFVDDEPNILQGLQRMLRPMRQEWTTQFAEGGANALAELAREHFDVVVSDMRMPGMTGAQLLNVVRDKYPHVVRVILSGQAERNQVMDIAGSTHQYLAKPCDAALLKDTVARACGLRQLLKVPKLVEVVSRLTAVPCTPGVVDLVSDALTVGEGSLPKAAQIISNEMGMSLKVLQLVNSAFFGAPRRVSDAEQAATLLGTDTLKSLLQSDGIFEEFDANVFTELAIREVYEARKRAVTNLLTIAECEGLSKKESSDALSAVSLCSIGKLVMAHCVPDSYRYYRTLLGDSDVVLDDAERSAFGATLPEVSAYLLALWGVPKEVVEYVSYHRNPETQPGATGLLLPLVHAAFALSTARDAGGPGHMNMPYLSSAGYGNRTLIWREACSEYAHA